MKIWRALLMIMAGGLPTSAFAQTIDNCPVDPAKAQAFWTIFWVTNITLWALALVLIVSLFSIIWKSWSRGDALVTAVVGAFAMLALMIGIGHAVAWNLVVCGRTPDLNGLKVLFVAIIAIFLLYVASQLKEAFSPSSPPSQTQPKLKTEPAISGVYPAIPEVPGNTDLLFFGTGFDVWTFVSLKNPDGVSQEFHVPNVTVRWPTHLQFRPPLDRGGDWRAKVTNNEGRSSSDFVFKVSSPAPQITAIDPANPKVATQRLTVRATNRMPNATATLVAPNGRKTRLNIENPNINEFEVAVQLQQGNDWKIVLQNPGNDQSAQQVFNVQP